MLLEHESVAEAAVVPSPDPLRLAVPKAYVVLAAGFEPDRETAALIFAYSMTHLAPYKRIRRLEFADLPKTISGKIRRVELRGREDRSMPPAAARPDRRIPARGLPRTPLSCASGGGCRFRSVPAQVADGSHRWRFDRVAVQVGCAQVSWPAQCGAGEGDLAGHLADPLVDDHRAVAGVVAVLRVVGAAFAPSASR